jgi:uncharacterized membrane protein
MRMKKWLLPAALFAGASLIGYVGTQWMIPRLIMSVATKRVAERGGFNTMLYGKLATPDNQPIVRPSPDLAYSSCPFDLSEGPVLINVVPVPGHYSSLSVFDAATDVAFVRNDVQAGGKPYKIILAQDGQATPEGSEVVRLKGARGIALIRLLLADPAEMVTLDGVRRQSACGPIVRAIP